jgi:Subtilase family
LAARGIGQPGTASGEWLYRVRTGARHRNRHGVRIAHLDTGYWPPQVSTPRHIRRDLGYNFSENNTNTTDPGTSGVLRNPGHGTATSAILSGNTVDLIYQGQQYTGDIGGAPDAEVVPVRIGPSVVHFYGSAMAQGMDYALAPRETPRTAIPPTNAMSSRSATADCPRRAGPMRSIISTMPVSSL